MNKHTIDIVDKEGYHILTISTPLTNLTVLEWGAENVELLDKIGEHFETKGYWGLSTTE